MTKAEKLGMQREIGLRMIMAREIAGLTQHELAARAAISRPQIANLELGRSDLPATTLIRIARALGIKPGRLLP